MLDLSAVDLDLVVTALEDRSDPGGTWWIDGKSGDVWLWSLDLGLPAEDDPEQRPQARCIEPLPSRVGYGDLEDFIAGVQDRRGADLIHRAITGRGAFRRFKGTLVEFPELRQTWFEFHDRRMRRRAIQLLADEGLVHPHDAARAIGHLSESSAAIPSAHPRGCRTRSGVQSASPVRRSPGRCRALRLPRPRRRPPESDVDLAVILDNVASPWDELRHMDDVLWRHTLHAGITITATPIDRAAWSRPARPLVRAARAEGRALA